MSQLIRRTGRNLYIRLHRRRGVAIEINQRRYRVSATVARGIPCRLDIPALAQWLDLVRGCDAAIDAGANIGVWSILAAAEMSSNGHILAVEPAPATFEILRDCARVSQSPARITAVHGALGDHTGTVRLVLDSPTAATNHIAETEDDGVVVPLLTIDELVSHYGIRPTAMKVDVEGAELLVLRGARHTMHHVRPNVVLELHWNRGLGATPESILDLANDYRYMLVDEFGRDILEPSALLRQNWVTMRPR